MKLTIHPEVPATTIMEALHTHGLQIDRDPTTGELTAVRTKCAHCTNPAVISERGKLLCPECCVAIQLNRW